MGGSSDTQWTLPLVELSAELALWQRRPKDARDEIAEALGRLRYPRRGQHQPARPGHRAGGARRGRRGGAGRKVARIQSDEIRRVTSGYLVLVREIESGKSPRTTLAGPHGGGMASALRSRGGPGAGRARLGGVVGSRPRVCGSLGMPYQQAYARWRQAEAHLAAPGPASCCRCARGRAPTPPRASGPSRFVVRSRPSRAARGVDLDRQRSGRPPPEVRRRPFG